MITVDHSTQNKKVNPQKFAMWIAIGSIIMMFAGFTSGLIVRKSQGNWVTFEIPHIFYISTVIILLSSLFMHLSLRTFKAREMKKHELFVILTMLSGLSFAILQYVGFKQLFGVLPWNNNVSFQFIMVIIGVHAIHILGGVIALLVMFAITFNRRKKVYSSNTLEIVSTYWHFVDILWIYLFVFFLVMS